MELITKHAEGFDVVARKEQRHITDHVMSLDAPYFSHFVV
jgi:hypothetical protein